MSISLPRPVQTYLTVSHLRGFAELAEGDGAEGEDRADVGNTRQSGVPAPGAASSELCKLCTKLAITA